MIVILMRHAESFKNKNNSFSTNDNKEEITNLGIEQTEMIAEKILEFSKKNNINVEEIIAANSCRAKSTAKIISKIIDCPISLCDNFLSITSDEKLKGKTENEVEEIDSTFIHELSLYRTGIFNAYNYSTVASILKDGTYEDKVIKKIDDICVKKKCVVMIMHHSSLTAALIHFARVGYNYPKSFYGNISANLGNIFLIDYTINNCNIILANENPNKLSDTIVHHY